MKLFNDVSSINYEGNSVLFSPGRYTVTRLLGDGAIETPGISQEFPN